jgi:DNA-directed RNA polymerase subunit RPC12/RpoP
MTTKCPSCETHLEYEDAIEYNKWGDVHCPYCGANVLWVVGVVPKKPGKWRLFTDDEAAQLSKLRNGE